MKTSDTINDYLKLEAYVYQYCDEHKLTDEERKIAEEYLNHTQTNFLVFPHSCLAVNH